MNLSGKAVGFVTTIFFAVMGLVASTGAVGLELPVLWSTDLKTFTESGPTVADIDGDGKAEMVVAGREEIIALNGKGEESWRWRTRGRFMTYPVVLARDGRTSLIYAADASGLFTCLDGAGGVVWQVELDGPSSWSAPSLHDLDGDGAHEVIQTDETGTVWAFEAMTGEARWQTRVTGMPSSPSVGDVTGDGKAEVVVVTGAGVVAALAADGALLWERSIGGSSETWATSAPVIFAASDGSGRIVAASNAGQVFCLDAKGAVLWSRPTRGPVAATVSVGDLDLDGVADVFVATQTGVIYRFDERGKVIWDVDMQGRSLAAGAIVDLNGDGRIEYALSTQGGRLLVLNDVGEFVFDRQFGHRTINVTPAFGDLTPDSPGLEMVLTGGEAGLVICLGTPAPVGAIAQWDAYRGDALKSGTWFGLKQEETARMVPENLAWDQVFTGEPVRFAITNPGDGALDATAVCVRPDGAHLAATTRVLGRRGELLLPVDVVVPGNYGFSWSLADGDGRTVHSGARDVSLQPFANDRAVAARAIEALRNAADDVEATLPLSAAALRGEATLLTVALDAVRPLHETASGGGVAAERAAIETTAALVTRARRALGVAETVGRAAALGSGTSLVAFEGALWENRGADNQLPDRVVNPVQISRRIVRGEHESVALGLFNVMDRPLEARVLVEVPDGGPSVSVRRAVPVATSFGETSWDALPELDESAVVTVPSLSTREVWLDVDAALATAGTHRIVVRLQALNGAGVVDGPASAQSVPPPETTVEIVLRALPFEMAPSGALRLCAWARLDAPSIDDMLAHGNNVFIGPQGVPQYDEDGALVGFDYTEHDRFVAPFVGKDVVLLLNGVPALRGDLGSPEYGRDLKVHLDDLVAHMADNGFDTDHFALYPFDEPGGHGWHAIDQLVALGKQVRAANPAVMVYVDGGGELPMFEAMAPYVDIWCPAIPMLPDPSPEMEIMRTTGKMLWSYDCGYGYARPAGPNIKNINIVGQFRTAALFAFRHGATGIGYWCYNIGEDPWGRVRHEYALVYPGKTKPVPSRRWEAVREGIEDYRIVTALRRRLEASDVGNDARDRIRHLLDVSLPAMTDQSFEETKLGLARHVLDATNNDATIRTFRAEIMDCVETLIGP